MGRSYSWFGDTNDIPDITMRNAVIDAVNMVDNIQLKPDKVETINGSIFTTHHGYYYSHISSTPLPFNVDHIIEHIIS